MELESSKSFDLIILLLKVGSQAGARKVILSKLKAAIETNDADAVRKIAKTVKDWSRKLPGSNTPVAFACEIGADQALAALIEAGAPVADGEGHFGTDPLTIAEAKEQLGVMQVLADSGKVLSASVDNALYNSARYGRESTARLIMERFKPAVPALTVSLANRWKEGRIIDALVAHGADVNVGDNGVHDRDFKGRTAMHLAAREGDFDGIRRLAEHGGNLNARDVHGRTPLMYLAEVMPGLVLAKKRREEREKEPVTPEKAAFLQRIAAQMGPYGDRDPADGMKAAHTLLELGADAKATDVDGNDALAYCEWECRREPEKFPEEFSILMQQSGAKGGAATFALFQAVSDTNLEAAGRAISDGADVNAVCPGGRATPLCWSSSLDMMKLLLSAGADPTKAAGNNSPLLLAAQSGLLDQVKFLVETMNTNAATAGDLGRAYSVALSAQKYEVVDYLKSIGVKRPVPAEWKLLEAGVGMWEDFCEMVVKADAETVANGVAAVIKGRVTTNAYEQSFDAGKNCYVILQPKGMSWSNVLRLVPAMTRKDGLKSLGAFGKKLANAGNASVIIAQYNDASDAVGMEQIEADGSVSSDEGWDQPSLEEMIEHLGDKSPPWATRTLAKMKKKARPSSSDRLELLAHRENFVMAAFGIDYSPGRQIEVVVEGLPAEAFDSVAFVTA